MPGFVGWRVASRPFLALWQGLEGCCWLVDTLLIDPLIRFFNIGDTN